MSLGNPYNLDSSKYGTHSLIRANIGVGKNVLDIGCNDGYLGKGLVVSNRFFGLDFSDACVAQAKKVYVDAARYDLNDLRALPWDIRFDTIVCADILEHILRPEDVMAFFARNYLADDGRIIVSLPNVANWQIRLNLFFGRFDYQEKGIMDRTHLRFYTYKTGREMVEKCGMKIEGVLGGASCFGPLITIFPFLRSLLSTNMIFICRRK